MKPSPQHEGEVEEKDKFLVIPLGMNVSLMRQTTCQVIRHLSQETATISLCNAQKNLPSLRNILRKIQAAYRTKLVSALGPAHQANNAAGGISP